MKKVQEKIRGIAHASMSLFDINAAFTNQLARLWYIFTTPVVFVPCGDPRKSPRTFI